MIDIIIVNYNSTGYLLKCLKSIYDCMGDVSVRVFVYDNHSTNCEDRISIAFPDVIFKQNSFNVGFSKAVNMGIKESTAPYVLVLNPDTIIKEDFFSSILEYLKNKPEIGIVGPEIINPDGSLQGSARAFPKLWMAFNGRNSFLTRWFPNNRISRRSVLNIGHDRKTPMCVDWVSGACMFIKREAIDDVGLLDEHFFMYWEDADWCKRMWKKGWKVAYFPRASIVHHVGCSSSKRPLRSILEFHKSCYKIIRKYNIAPFYITNSLVIAGLSVRLCVVIFLNRIRKMSSVFKSFRKSNWALIRTLINFKSFPK